MAFVCDAMLGRTARFLRLFGYNTLYSSKYSDPELLQIASNEKRTLLTRDIALHQQAIKLALSSCLLLETTYIDRITALVMQLNLNLQLNPSNSRCATCNANISPIPKDKVKGKIPDKTYAVYNEFWICTNGKCGKIFYQGHHWDNITKIFMEIKKTVESNKDKKHS